MKRLAVPLLLVPLLGSYVGCATFEEDHYFRTVNPNTGKVANYFRLKVRGSSGFSSSRYVAGFYDERAVDLFFNELKTAADPNAPTDSRELFPSNLIEPGTDQVLRPLSPDRANGAFVMILSTNANAVAGAIGQFSENQLVADAITNLVNRRLVREAAQTNPQAVFEWERARAIGAEIDGLINLVPGVQGGAVPSSAELTSAYLRVLNAIARAQGRNTPFASFADAATWFESQGRP